MTCANCLDTGWAFIPHSDEGRERCSCGRSDPPTIQNRPRHFSKRTQLDELLAKRYHAKARGCVTRKTNHVWH